MKKIFTLPEKLVTFIRRTTSVIHLSATCLAIFIIAGMPVVGNAQFVKTFNSIASCTGTGGNLSFSCITKSKTAGRYFIAGTQDASVYMCEIDAFGVVQQEKLVGVNNSTYMLRSMITDADGNIVIVGSLYRAGGYVAFLMKLSPTFNILLHRTYNWDVTGTKSTYFSDIKDAQQTNNYYISGAVYNPSQVGATVLVTVNRNTGNIVTRQGDDGGGINNYDALVLTPTSTSLLPPPVIATGMISTSPALGTFRPRINRHNSSLSFVFGKSYIHDYITDARIYSLSLINDGDSLLNCWHGNISGTVDTKSTGVIKSGVSSLLPGWQKEYIFTPASQPRKILSKVDTASNGYVVEGNWWSGSAYINFGAIGEMILLRTTKNGTPVWSRKIKDVFTNTATHNASFVTDNGSIYAVGFKMATASSPLGTGVVVQIPLSNGAMDTTCSVVQTVTVKDFTFNQPTSVTNTVVNFKDTIIYYPLNCTKSDTLMQCVGCNKLAQLPSSDFLISATMATTIPGYYPVTAFNYNTGFNSQWIIEEIDAFGTYFPGTRYTSSGTFWGSSTTTTFGGYNGTSSSNELSSGYGLFQDCHRYRFRHILSTTNNCGITKSDTSVPHSAYICSVGKAILQIDDKAQNNDAIRMLPNPVTGSSFTIESFSTTKSVVTVKIVDMHGRQVAIKEFTSCLDCTNRYSMDAKQLANGAYTAVILSEGKTTTQKFIVSNK